MYKGKAVVQYDMLKELLRLPKGVEITDSFLDLDEGELELDLVSATESELTPKEYNEVGSLRKSVLPVPAIKFSVNGLEIKGSTLLVTQRQIEEFVDKVLNNKK